jgi:hypothetical protein
MSLISSRVRAASWLYCHVSPKALSARRALRRWPHETARCNRVGVERRVKINKVNRLIRDVLAQHIEIVSIKQGVHSLILQCPNVNGCCASFQSACCRVLILHVLGGVLHPSAS